MLQLYRRLIALRREEPSLAHGAIELLDVPDPHVLAWTRAAPGARRILVALNLETAPASIDLRALGASGHVLASTTDPRRRGEEALGTLTLGRFEGVVVSSDRAALP